MASATVGREGSPPLQGKRDAGADRPAARADCHGLGAGVEQERILASAALGVSDDRPLGLRSSADPRPSADVPPGATRNRPPLSSAERSRRGPVPQDGDRPRSVVPSRVACGAHGQRSTAPSPGMQAHHQSESHVGIAVNSAHAPPPRSVHVPRSHRGSRRPNLGDSSPVGPRIAMRNCLPTTLHAKSLARYISARHMSPLTEPPPTSG